MANEIIAKYTANVTDLYACVFNASKQVYDAAGANFETWDDGQIDNYDIPLAENGGGGLYFADFPAVAAGTYTVVIYKGAKTAGDDVVGSGKIVWDGSAEVVFDGAVKLSADGLDDVVVAEPTGDPSGWSFAKCLRWLIMRFMNKHTSDNFSGIVVHDTNGSALTSQPVTEVNGVKSVSKVQ